MIKLLHNCPNCGAPLEADGYCVYCKTKIRYANELEVKQFDRYSQEPMEILLKIKDGDHTIIFPIKGYLKEITREYTSDSVNYDGYVLCSRNPTSISFTVEGYLTDLD